MRHFPIILIVFLIWHPSFAQAPFAASGKQFIVHSKTEQLAEITAMDQHTQLITNIGVDARILLKKSGITGYEMILTPLRVKMYMSSLGKEQQFDSDTLTDRSNPALPAFIQNLHQSYSWILDSAFRSVASTHISSNDPFDEFKNDAGKYFLSISGAFLKRGFQWTDSIVAKDSKYRNRNTIMQLTDSTVEVNLTKEMVSTQTGSHVKGFGTATRIYNRSDAMLIRETEEMDLVGANEMGSLSFPLTLKFKRSTTVTDKNKDQP